MVGAFDVISIANENNIVRPEQEHNQCINSTELKTLRDDQKQNDLTAFIYTENVSNSLSSRCDQLRA